jgi:hypothetical protein
MRLKASLLFIWADLMALFEGSVLVCRADTATGGYNGQTNSDNFEEWVTKKVILTLASPSAISGSAP